MLEKTKMKKHIRSVTLAVFLTMIPQFAAAQQGGTVSGDNSTDMNRPGFRGGHLV